MSARALALGMGALAVGVGVGVVLHRQRLVTGPRNVAALPGSSSSQPPGAAALGLHPLDPRSLESTCLRLAQSVVGRPYSYGGGSPRSPWPQGEPGLHGGVGWDCSGLQLGFSTLLLRYRWDGRDRTARGVAEICSPVALGAQRPGDVATYKGRHITAVLTHPDASGHSRVLSASGGSSTTNGDDPQARVRIWDRGDYRRDFLTYMRLPPVQVSDRQAVTCMAVHHLLAGSAPPNDPRLSRAELRDELAERYGALPEVRRWLGAVS